MAGFLFNNQCYSALADATSAYWTANPVSIMPEANSYVTSVAWSGTQYQFKQYRINNGSLQLNYTTNVPVQSFPDCDPAAPFVDGMALGWGVAAAIVAAWVIKNLRRGL